MIYQSKEVNDDNMWNEIYQQAYCLLVLMVNKFVLVVSLIASIFMSAIGYPKEIILFIFILSIVDIITKHFSNVISAYGSLSFENYIKAWREKILTSRQLKNGISVKIILYSSILYIANQLAIVPGIMFGQEISGVMYNVIIFIEIVSILENAILCGCDNLLPLLNYIKSKQKALFGNKKEENNNK